MEWYSNTQKRGESFVSVSKTMLGFSRKVIEALSKPKEVILGMGEIVPVIGVKSVKDKSEDGFTLVYSPSGKYATVRASAFLAIFQDKFHIALSKGFKRYKFEIGSEGEIKIHINDKINSIL